MISKNLQGLLDSVVSGDAAAAARLRHLLRPVVSRAVRRVVETHERATALERHVQALLDDVGTLCPPHAPMSVEQITQAICSQTVAQMQATPYRAQAALETVLA